MSDQEKKREAARLRKRKQRERDKARRESRGAEVVEVEMYRGTLACMQALMDELGYEEQAEVITRLLHGAHRLMARDRSQVEALLKV